jgi:serine/threonine-protein kinase
VVTPERWQVIKNILAEAMEMPASDRDAFVERESAGDDDMRRELRSLLAASGGSDGGLNTGQLAADPDRALHAILATALGQQYEVIRPLGRGGMGAVYLARERALERFVAIKVLRPDLATAPDSRERFRREARVAAQLSHAGILPLHTFGEVNGIWYFVMGYVRGVSLAERLRVEGRLSSDEAHRILGEMAEALECAHRHGVIHRDIKPANILLDDESGRAMLADFGISKVHGAGDSLTGTGAIVGTPHYMSPEQSIGAPTVDERSDIYSLGAVGYTMLSGREPFADTIPEELTLRRLSHDPVSLQIVAPSVPPDLAAIVMRSLAREPADRWPTARSLREALARASGDSLSSLPESLRDLPTFGPYALLWAALWTTLAVRTGRHASDRVLLLLIAVVVPFGFLLHIWNVGRNGLGWSGIGRVAFWPPDWWGMWWPRAFRRPTDLWRRLPWPGRAVRSVLSIFLFALPLMILFREQLEAAVGEGGPLEWFGMVESALVVGAAAATIGALVWAYRRGLSWSETVRVLFGATAPSPGWTSPAILRLLAPATGASRPPNRDTPAEYRRAILDLVPLLRAAAADVGAESALAATGLFAAIEICDAQIETHNRDASVREIERLEARLSALETGPVANDAPRQELIALVRRELDLVRQMRIGSEALSQRRARLFNLMRGLWAQLCVVRDGAAEGPGVMTKLTDRVRALCGEIGEELPGHEDPASSRLSQARAVAHSRLTVAGDISRASAVSSMLRPPK